MVAEECCQNKQQRDKTPPQVLPFLMSTFLKSFTLWISVFVVEFLSLYCLFQLHVTFEILTVCKLYLITLEGLHYGRNKNRLTWIINLIQTQPEEAMIFAEFGMRLKRAGRQVSAQWSILWPSCWAKYLKVHEQTKLISSIGFKVLSTTKVFQNF